MNKVKVLIIDDSATVRQILHTIFSTDPQIEVIGVAADPFAAVRKMKENKPDVITLDIELPRMDGITFLQKIMSQSPIPVIIISSFTQKGTGIALKALEYGAIEVISKPKVHTKEALKESSRQLCDLVKTAARARLVKRAKPRTNSSLSASYKAPKLASYHSQIHGKLSDKLIVIGASTGGTEAIKSILQSLPPESPGVVIVLHMPKMFTNQYALRLDSICKVRVKEAEHGDPVVKGQVLIAPGDQHVLIQRQEANNVVQLHDSPAVNRHKPSVDVLFKSAALQVGKRAIGILLTGMGADGAQGLLEMKDAGAYTIAQDEHTSVVFGMPKEAIKKNAASKVLPIDKIAGEILRKSYLGQ